MDTSPATPLTCTQCGGELHPDEGQTFLTCPYCSATVFLDKSQVVFHWSLSPTLGADEALAALRRWMSGSQTVKDLDQKSSITGQTFQYFPLWLFRWSTAEGKESMDLQPAAATSVTELTSLRLPAGDLQRYDPSLDSQAAAPSVPLEAAREWLQQVHGPIQVRESSLVHVPTYLFKYTFNGRSYTAVVEAATGSVLANLYPTKPEAPYRTAGCVTAGVYLFLAMLPLFAANSGGRFSGGLLGVAVVLALIATPFLFAFAAWVASKI